MSLHDDVTWFWRDRRIDFVDAEGTQHHGGTVGAGCDGALGGAVAEVDINDTHGLERRQGFGGGQIEAGALELLFDGAMDHESERGDLGLLIRLLRVQTNCRWARNGPVCIDRSHIA